MSPDFKTNTVRTRHNFVGEIRIFSVKICINPYPSFVHRFDEYRKRSRDSYRHAVDRKLRHCVIKIDSQQQRTKIGTLGPYFTWRDSRIRPTQWTYASTRSIVLHGGRNLPFFGNLVEKASCVDNKTVLFCYTLFINCFSVICVKSVSQRDTAVSSQNRSKSVLDTDNPYQVACLTVVCYTATIAGFQVPFDRREINRKTNISKH